MLNDLNPTTRCYPRTEREAFYAWDTIEGPYTPDQPKFDVDFWVAVTLAFAAGFLVCYLSVTA